MPRWLRYAILIVIFLLLASYPLARQFDTGTIEGIVTDDLGPLTMVSIQARNVITGTTTHTETDVGGYYQMESLRPGRYSLWVQAAGHDSVSVPDIPVGRGETVHHDIHLARTQNRIPTP